MLIGYMRVSSDAARQTTDRQRDALRAAGVDEHHRFQDQASGVRDDRLGPAQALAFLRPGDVLVVWKLDRLGRAHTSQGLADPGRSALVQTTWRGIRRRRGCWSANRCGRCWALPRTTAAIRRCCWWASRRRCAVRSWWRRPRPTWRSPPRGWW